MNDSDRIIDRPDNLENQELYMEARLKSGQWYGVVYFWDETGNKQTLVYRSDFAVTQPEVIDAVQDWLDEHGLEASW